MKNGMKVVFGAIVIVALIAFKVYNRTPGWREAIKGNRSVPVGKAFVQFFSLKKEAKLRLTVTEKSNRPLLVYWLAKKDSDSLQSKNPNVDRLAKRIPDQTLCEGGQLTEPKEFKLMNGDYSIYFEAMPQEGDTKAEPRQVDFLIEEYR